MELLIRNDDKVKYAACFGLSLLRKRVVLRNQKDPKKNLKDVDKNANNNS